MRRTEVRSGLDQRYRSHDADESKALSRFCVDPEFAFYDGNTRGLFEPDDPVYIHINPTDSAVDVNDVRLTQFGSFPAGSQVGITDPDVGYPLSHFGINGFPRAEVRYFDVDGNYSSKSCPITPFVRLALPGMCLNPPYWPELEERLSEQLSGRNAGKETYWTAHPAWDHSFLNRSEIFSCLRKSARCSLAAASPGLIHFDFGNLCRLGYFSLQLPNHSPSSSAMNRDASAEPETLP